MKQKYVIFLIMMVLILIFLNACGVNGSESDEPQGLEDKSENGSPSDKIQELEKESESSGVSNENTGAKEDDMKMEISQTGWTEAVPATYTEAADEQGSVVRLDYRSRDYVRDGAAITKTAYVYTPYGYDENDTKTRYNILYLMHGWGGHAGEYFEFAGIKNLFDNLIANGDIPPLIIVSATFYNENSSIDFGSSIQEFREFHRDFENYLMPAVEGKFHTYAQSASEEDLKASRDHRAFGGFSLGSVTTWLQFCYDYDYIRYFLPMSGSCWYYGTYGDFQTENNVDFIEQLVKDENLDERGYFIYHAVGTQDAVKSQTLMQAEEMLKRNDVFTPEHYVFYQKDGGYHDFDAVQEYLYNALPLFFHDSGDFQLTWYNYIAPNKTVEIVNYMKNHAEAGETIFYDIYTDEEKAVDPDKADTGLFFFKGNPGGKFAVCNAGDWERVLWRKAGSTTLWHFGNSRCNDIGTGQDRRPTSPWSGDQDAFNKRIKS